MVPKKAQLDACHVIFLNTSLGKLDGFNIHNIRGGLRKKLFISNYLFGGWLSVNYISLDLDHETGARLKLLKNIKSKDNL